MIKSLRKSISICIPAYNAGLFLRFAIESALRQSRAADEVLVSDNGSTDNTALILDQYRSRVRVVRPPRHLPMIGNYYFALENARSSHAVLLSADDILLPGFLASVTPFLEVSPFVAGGGFACDASMRVRKYFGLGYPREILPPRSAFARFLESSTYVISGATWNRKVLLSRPRLPDSAQLAGDWYFAIAVSASHPVAMLRRPLCAYRYHDQNNSHSKPLQSGIDQGRMFDFLCEHGGLTDEQYRAARKRAARYALQLEYYADKLKDENVARVYGSSLVAEYRSFAEMFCNKWLSASDRQELPPYREQGVSTSAGPRLRQVAQACLGYILTKHYGLEAFAN